MSGIINFLSAVFSGFAGLALSVFISRGKTNGLKKELKEAKAEIERLKTRLNELTINPLALKNGVYYDAAGNPYCSACYGSVYERTPLKTLNQQGSWTLYQCPKCHERYEEGKFLQTRPKNWDPLA